MNYFSVPADFKKETLDRYFQLNRAYPDSRVKETYGQITVNNIMGSGRAFDLVPEADMARLEAYIAYSKSRGIGFNYTLNATCTGNREFTEDGMKQILSFLDQLKEIGVNSLTIALPPLIELVRLKNYPFKIKTSTLCQIVNANKAAAYKKLGADTLVLDESINRDFAALKQIVEVGEENVELITNVICHKNCIYRMFHYNQASHDRGETAAQSSVTYYSHRCMMKRCERVDNILKLAWIRPEDLKYYREIGICNFKLQGRQAVLKGDPVRAVECYMKESYQGNLIELLDLFLPTNAFLVHVDNRKLEGFIKPFVETPGFCKNACHRCRYCETFAKNAMDFQAIEETFALATGFYRQYDDFINIAGKLSGSNAETLPDTGQGETFKPIKKTLDNSTFEEEFDFDFL
jgi:collagenase-like PrtC family protease